MRNRMTRIEQVERNRDVVLDAARRVFEARGYAGASLDAIAEEAGFSKGVVYSQFDSKADLFFALLERRIDERAAQNQRLAERVVGLELGPALMELGEQVDQADASWTLLMLEFRAHAARDPELNRRYARAHARTLDMIAGLLDAAYKRAGVAPRFPPRTLAELCLALASGIVFERIANRDALPSAAIRQITKLLLASDASVTARRPAGSRKSAS